MTWWNGNIFRVAGPLWGEFNGHRWLPLTKASDAGLNVFFDLRLNRQLSKQSWRWCLETALCSLWRHCNGKHQPVSYFLPPTLVYDPHSAAITCEGNIGNIPSVSIYVFPNVTYGFSSNNNYSRSLHLQRKPQELWCDNTRQNTTLSIGLTNYNIITHKTGYWQRTLNIHSTKRHTISLPGAK